ncbi:hypothetical protein [Nannocystis sp.]|uniref:nSTAND1 domain-containing NTPase n=1 Tax=Nannocystis sp. TaxID=1962667 RepID=UPI0025FAB21D|nr:hypothetical protein [Nannocystis sp.]MBK7829273.1 hypothetical protein [Nannocystis sp.]
MSQIELLSTMGAMRAPGQQAQEVLDSQWGVFESQWQTWKWLRDRLRKSGLDPHSMRELRSRDVRSSWIILAQPAAHLIKHFELAPEVLVICSPWEEFQANDIRDAEETFRKEVRVDPGFALVVTHDNSAETRLRPVVPDHRRYLFVRDEELRTAQDPQMFLHRLLRDALSGRHLFDLRNPATGPQFFGRERTLEGLERDLVGGHSLGVFGLRKVGKTSLLRRLAAKFREVERDAMRVLPVEVDLLEIPFNRRDIAGAAALIDRNLQHELERAKITLPGTPMTAYDRLVAVVEFVHSKFGARVTLMLDEYEALLGGKLPLRDGIELLDWLRGIAQSHPNAFNLVLAGRNSRRLAPARIEGLDNPMHRFLRSVPVSGLEPEECRTMIRKIGGRMALRFTPEALDVMVCETGGHPGLVRTLGDLVDQQVPVADRSPATVDAALVSRLLPRFSRQVDEDMRELVNASNDFSQEAIHYLTHTAHSLPWIGGRIEASIHDALVGYGILERGRTAFRIGHFGTWLRENYETPVRASHG